MRKVLIAALIGFSHAASAQGTTAPAVAPSSGWVLDYGENRCRIVRSFGEGEAASLIYFEQTEPASQLNWVVAGPSIGLVRAGRKVTLQFGPGNPPFEMEHNGATLGQFGQALSSTGFERRISTAVLMSDREASRQSHQESARYSRELVSSEGAKVEWLDVQSERGQAVRFALGNMRPVYDAMNACMADLLMEWGLDPQLERQRANGPVPTNYEVLATRIQRSYPSSAVDAGKQAMIAARVMVDAKGKVTDCAIIDLTEAEEFGAGVCRQITTTARFDPATDANGAAMPSYYIFRIRYELS